MTFFARVFRPLLVGIVVATAAIAQAHATWPERPVTIIVPFGAGGAPDIITRIIADRLSPRLGQPVVVENRPGAGGNLGTQFVSTATPDGYTLAYANNGTLATNQFLFSKIPYDPTKLTSIVGMFSTPNLLVVAADSPIKNVAELIAYAKKNPEKFNFASTGVGTSAHLGGELLKSLTGIAGQHIPYKSSPPALQDIAAGDVHFMFVNVASGMPMVDAGKVKVLAITSKERWPLLPNVPTMAEAGVPGYEMEAWGGLAAPPGTPDAIVQRLVKEVNAVLKEPQTKAMMDKLMSTGLGGTSEDFIRLQVAEREKWRDLVKKTGATVQ